MLLAASCGGGGADGGGASQAIVSVPPGLVGGYAASNVVSATRVSLEFREDDLQAVELVAPARMNATPWDGGFVLLDVPLEPGENELRIRIDTLESGWTEHRLAFSNAAQPESRVWMGVEPEVVTVGQPVRFHVLPADRSRGYTSMLLDHDGDGRVDLELPYQEQFAFTPTTVGVGRSRVHLRTSDGRLVGCGPHASPQLRVFGESPLRDPRTIPTPLADLVDLQVGRDSLVRLLSRRGRGVVHLDPRTETVTQHALPGVVQPSGLWVGDEGELYVTDAMTHAVHAFRFDDGYVPDLAFGAEGTIGEYGADEGQLDSPSDVVVVQDLRTGEPRVCVADSGNGRIQVFDASGESLRILTPPGDAAARFEGTLQLDSVMGMSLAVLDRGTGTLRVLDPLGNEHLVVPPDRPGEGLRPFSCGVTADTGGNGWTVTDCFRREVVLLDEHGRVSQVLSTERELSQALVVRTHRGPQLLGIERDVAEVFVADVSEDPDGYEPTAVVDRVVELLSMGQVQELRSLLEPALFETIEAMGRGSAELRFLQAQVASLAEPAVEERGAQLCVVSTAGSSTDGPFEVEWILRKGRGTGRWHVSEF